MKQLVDIARWNAGNRKQRVARTRRQIGPSQNFSFHDVTIDVFLAKDFFNRSWVHHRLKDIVQQCRKTFSRYGNVANILDYDTKSAVYLGRATYTIDGKIVHEWLSFRLVPALGEPRLTEDLKGCEIGGRNLLEALIEQQIVDTRGESLSQILTLSRLCGIHPYLAEGENPVELPKKLQYGAILFACMQSCFNNRQHLESLEPKVITALFQRPFLDAFMAHGATAKIEIPTAREVLRGSLKNPSIVLKRDEKSYRYPGYFLHLHELLKALTALIDSQRLRDTTIIHHAKLNAPLREIRKRNPRTSTLLEELEHLSELITHEGLLHDSDMTGSELREYIDIHVSDGPTLHLLAIDDWRKEIARFINSII
ncbi:hypothetical protein OAG68_00895 [bacterium]|nr:hypothetical protein [bacterium]